MGREAYHSLYSIIESVAGGTTSVGYESQNNGRFTQEL
jgi:hypothetical protein